MINQRLFLINSTQQTLQKRMIHQKLLLMSPTKETLENKVNSSGIPTNQSR